MAYVPPHRRGGRSGSRETPWVSLSSLDDGIKPEDSISVVGASLGAIPLESLTEQEVAALLASLGLGKYADACLAIPLRGRDLPHCREADLEEIGIKFRPHRLSLLEEVARMVEHGVPVELLAADTGCERRDGAEERDGSGSTLTSRTPTWLVSAQAQLSSSRRVGDPSDAPRRAGSASADAEQEGESASATRGAGATGTTARSDRALVCAPADPLDVAGESSHQAPLALLSTPDRHVKAIEARLEGLSLRSDAGTAVRAVERGAGSGWGGGGGRRLPMT